MRRLQSVLGVVVGQRVWTRWAAKRRPTGLRAAAQRVSSRYLAWRGTSGGRVMKTKKRRSMGVRVKEVVSGHALVATA